MALTCQQKVSMTPIVTNNSILDASKYKTPTKPIQQLNSAKAFMDRKPEKVQNGIFSDFLPILRYFSGTPPKFHRHFCRQQSVPLHISKKCRYFKRKFIWYYIWDIMMRYVLFLKYILEKVNFRMCWNCIFVLRHISNNS